MISAANHLFREPAAMLKVIETHFDGYHFRSRTEARWAVFFRACGIRYEYELEGFDLGGVGYLPDFWLPDFKRWFEVKGKFPSESELEKCYGLARENQNEVLIAAGPPNPEFEQITRVYPNDEFVVPDKDWREWKRSRWRQGEPTNVYEDGWQFADDCQNDGTFWLTSDYFGAACIGPYQDRATNDLPMVGRSITARAFDAAKSARFGV